MAGASLMPHWVTNTSEIMLILTSIMFLHITDAQVGVCYGIQGDNLPSPAEVIALCTQNNIQRIRIYNPNTSILEALRGNPISVIIGVANEDIQGIAGNTSLAESWISQNILNYANVNFRYIAVGNEISPLDSASASIAPSVAPAMQNLYNALIKLGLGAKIKVSTALSTRILGNSFPPSAGEFKPEISTFMASILKFLVNNEQPFLLNAYTYFAYDQSGGNISLNYAIFNSSSPVVIDGTYQYYNLFDAILDATYVALGKAGGANLEIVVTETGWPSDGASAATVENAKTYNSNLVKHVNGEGTPRRAGKPIETYIFDLIDENQKTPELEKHWGLFYANKQPKYPITFGTKGKIVK